MTYQYANIFSQKTMLSKNNSKGFDNTSSFFCSKILHREFMDCSTRFVNFSDAVCAIDSTAILFYKPKEETEQKIILQVLADRGYVGIESYHK